LDASENSAKGLG